MQLNDYDYPKIACFLFFVSMLGYWLSVGFPRKKKIFRMSSFFVLLSNFCLFLALLSRWKTEGYFPLSNLYESLLFLSWGISSLHLILEFRTKSRVLGSVITPILFLICCFSSLTLPTDMQKASALVPSLQSNWLMMHVSMMMISYTTLLLGSILSILYLLFSSLRQRPGDATYVADIPEISINLSAQNISNISDSSDKSNILKIRGFQNKGYVPKVLLSKNSLLETLDTWCYRIIGLGFPFLTIGIISGAVWANEAWGSYWSWDPKETWALITWLTFASYLHVRLINSGKDSEFVPAGKKAAIIGSFGFLVIWICYLGVNFLGKGLHSYGWVLK